MCFWPIQHAGPTFPGNAELSLTAGHAKVGDPELAIVLHWVTRSEIRQHYVVRCQERNEVLEDPFILFVNSDLISSLHPVRRWRVSYL